MYIGAVELEKLTLKKDALHKLKLPIEVKAGWLFTHIHVIIHVYTVEPPILDTIGPAC